MLFAWEIAVDSAGAQICFFTDVLNASLVEALPGKTGPCRLDYLLAAGGYVGFSDLRHLALKENDGSFLTTNVRSFIILYGRFVNSRVACYPSGYRIGL